jgi:S-adenosylmethionine:tRNA ribosyltransferase-isomerase
MDYKLSDFDYHLPDWLIAQSPLEPRDSSRLLCLNRQNGQMQDKIFHDIVDILTQNDVLVVNQTRVIKARLKGAIEKTSKACEIFLHKQIWENTWECLVYPGKKLKPGAKIVFFESKDSFLKRSQDLQPLSFEKGENSSEDSILTATILSLTEHGRIVEFSQSGQEFFDIIDRIGETPLPPYIKDHNSEAERYQTVYHDTAQAGSVAAPTAGLHFTPELLQKLEDKWVKIEKVTLHVWLGTFKNVKVEYIKNHIMHSEEIFIDKEVSERLNTYKQQGKRIIAVGTTSVRTLESFTNDTGILKYGHKDTSIFITPGYEWKFIDGLITNFHLPKSTLIMLVSSFAGYELTKKAYQHAVDSQYRFFSFGDAMFIA